jgi:hypothetical protein
MYYYHLLLTIYEPLLNKKTDEDTSPTQIVADASKYLRTLLRLYYLRHGFDAMDLYIVIPLILVGVECVDAMDEGLLEPQLENTRSTLMLIAKGLYSQRKNHYLAEALFRVIRGRMYPRDVVIMKASMNYDEQEDDKKQAMVQAVRSHWPVSVVKKKEEIESHILTSLVEEYGSLNVE